MAKIADLIVNLSANVAEFRTSMESAAGTRGSPGMVMISPQIATTNSAPAESRTSRTGMV